VWRTGGRGPGTGVGSGGKLRVGISRAGDHEPPAGLFGNEKNKNPEGFEKKKNKAQSGGGTRVMFRGRPLLSFKGGMVKPPPAPPPTNPGPPPVFPTRNTRVCPPDLVSPRHVVPGERGCNH